MFDIVETVGVLLLVVSYLIYLAIIIFVVCAKDSGERLRLLLIVGGLFFIVFLSEGGFSFSPSSAWSFTLAQMLIMVFLSLSGIKLLIGREIVVSLFLIYLLSLTNAFFLSFLVGAVSYIVVSYGFILAALDKIGNPDNTEKN